MKLRRCDQCEFYAEEDGTCRIAPPQILYIPYRERGTFDISSAFPQVSEDEWCADWMMKEKDAK